MRLYHQMKLPCWGGGMGDGGERAEGGEGEVTTYIEYVGTALNSSFP